MKLAHQFPVGEPSPFHACDHEPELVVGVLGPLVVPSGETRRTAFRRSSTSVARSRLRMTVGVCATSAHRPCKFKPTKPRCPLLSHAASSSPNLMPPSPAAQIPQEREGSKTFVKGFIAHGGVDCGVLAPTAKESCEGMSSEFVYLLGQETLDLFSLDGWPHLARAIGCTLMKRSESGEASGARPADGLSADPRRTLKGCRRNRA